MNCSQAVLSCSYFPGKTIAFSEEIALMNWIPANWEITALLQSSPTPTPMVMRLGGLRGSISLNDADPD